MIGEKNYEESNDLARFSAGLDNLNRPLTPSLDLGQNQDVVSPDQNPDEDVLNWWASNPDRIIDKTAPDYIETWRGIKRAFSQRNVDYAHIFEETATEIAKLPMSLMEGIGETKSVQSFGASSLMGIGQMYRDMYGLIWESENPTSPVFNIRKAARAMLGINYNGMSEDDEIDQWNQTRKFLWHSQKIQSGDETILDQYLDLSDSQKQQVKSLYNHKVAHAMGFIGLELPGIAKALTKSGSEIALAAGTSRVEAGLAEKSAQVTSIGSALNAVQKGVEGFASKVSQVTTGGLLYGAGKALELPAALAEGLIGRNIERASIYTGMAEATVKNAAVTAVAEGVEVVGMADVKGTVGVFGSGGIRTMSEFSKAAGRVNLDRAFGVVESSGTTGLTALEKVRTMNLSPTAKAVAKFVNITVDPLIQLSTGALKKAYKGAAEFAFLGYLNDRDRGAVSGGAMGLIWNGYTGGVRHTWSMFNGIFSNEIHIKNFDKNWMPEFEKFNPKAKAEFEKALKDIDALGSQKISSNARASIEMAVASLKTDKFSVQNMVVHRGSNADLIPRLIADGIDVSHFPKDSSGKYIETGQTGRVEFSLLNKTGGGLVPFLRISEKGFRPADFGHDLMGHVMTHGLKVKGSLPKYLAEFFGFQENGGIIPDEILTDKLARRAIFHDIMDVYADPNHPLYQKFQKQYKRIPVDSSGAIDPAYGEYLQSHSILRYEDYKNGFKKQLEQLRSVYTSHADYTRNDPYQTEFREPVLDKDGNPVIGPDGNPKMKQHKFGVQFMFEEPMGGHWESLFLHTNLKDINVSDADRPIRYWLERQRNNLFSQKVNELELAGVRIKKDSIISNDLQAKIQTEVYEDGKWKQWDSMDGFAKRMAKDAIDLEAEAIHRLSPERQIIEAKRTGKTYLFNLSSGGMTMKGKKEQNEILDERAKKSLQILEGLDDSIKPEVSFDEFGNKTIDLTKLNDKAWEALVSAGTMDATTALYGRLIRDTIEQYNRTGFASSNILTSTYWGDTHEIMKGGVLQRLYGADVPITQRMFVPYEMRLTSKEFDANGKPLAKSKNGITVTAVDYLVIHRRKINTWSRPDVQRIFSGIDHMNATFDRYLINMMSEPAVRVPSEQLFANEFGSNASKVRDICYNIFGAVKRGDEPYINSPGELGVGNKRGPNFPFHSLKLELMVDAERVSGKPLPYNHGQSYEGLRRNLSIDGFERITDKRFRDSQGYEIFKSGRYFKVYDPFGKTIDVAETFKKAAKIAAKNFKSVDASDKLPNPNAFWGGGTDIEDVRRIRSRIDNHLSNFNSNGTMKSIGYFDEMGKFVSVDTRLKSNAYSIIKAKYKSNDNKPYVTLDSDLLANHSEWEKLGNLRGRYDVGRMPILIEDSFDTTTDFGAGGSVLRISSLNSRGENANTTGVPELVFNKQFLDALEHPELINKYIQYRIDEAASHLLNGFSDRSSVQPMVTPFEDLFGVQYSTPNTNRLLAARIKALGGDSKNRKPTESEIKVVAETKSQNDHIERFLDSDLFDKIISGETVLPDEISKFGEKFKHEKSELVSSILNTWSRKIDEILKESGPLSADSRAMISKMIEFRKEFNKQSTYLPVPRENSFGKYASELDAVQFITLDGKRELKALELLSEFFEIVKNATKTRDGLAAYRIIAENLEHGIAQQSRVFPGSQELGFARGKEHFIANPVKMMLNLSDAYENPVIMLNGRSLNKSAGKYDGTIMTHSMYGIVTVLASDKNFRTGFKREFITPYFELEQPDNRTKSLKRTDVIPNNAKFEASTAYIANGAMFGPTDIATVPIGILETVIASNKDAEQKLIELKNSDKADNPYEYAVELMKLCLEKDMQQEAMLAEKTVSLMHYLLPGNKESRIESNFTKEKIRGRNGNNLRQANELSDLMQDPAYREMVKDRILDDKNAEFNLSLANYFAVGKDGEMPYEKRVKEATGTKAFQLIKTKAALKQELAYVKKVRDTHQYSDVNTQSMKSVGGFELGNDAGLAQERIKELERDGLIRVFGNGLTDKKYTLFELSDKNAKLTSLNQGRSELTPFIKLNNPVEGFNEYIKNYGDKNQTGDTLGDFGGVRLSDIFEHDLLYKHFPDFKDIPIQFTDSYGAAAISSFDGSRLIQIGIRSMIPPSMLVGSEGSPRFFAPDYSFKQMYASQNPAASVILHEVQHHLQHAAGHEIQETFAGPQIQGDKILGNFLRLLGASDKDFSYHDFATNDAPYTYNTFKYGYQNLSPDSVNAVKQQMISLQNSPVVKSIETHAKPLLKSTVTRMAGIICELADAGIAHDSLAKEALQLDARINTITNAADLHSLFLDFENLEDKAFKVPEINEQLGLTSDDSYAAASKALGMYTTISLAADDATLASPINTITNLRSSFENFCLSLYLLSPKEIQARETQRRAGMNSAELKNNPRSDVPLPDTTLGILKKALNSSNILTPNDVKYPNSMKSIGDLIGQEQGSSDSLKQLGKLSLVSYIAFRGTKELDKLGRFMVRQYGWEIDKSGNAVLTNKQYTVRGDWVNSANKIAEANKEGLVKSAEYETNDIGDSIAVQGSIPGMQDTYTIKDILGIAEAVIEAEEGLSVGSSVMDNVLSNSFPSMVKGGEIMNALGTSGFIHTPDALLLSGIKEISEVFNDVYLTKRDLANLLAYYHKSFGINSVQIGEFGVAPSAIPIDVKTLLKSAGREKLISAASGTLTDHINQLSGIGQVIGNQNKSMNIGSYRFNKGELKFEPEQPSWVPDEAFTSVTERVLNSEYYKNLRKNFIGEYNSGQEAQVILNQRIFRKMILIEPILKKLIENAELQKTEMGEAWTGFIAGLYEKVFTDALEIQPSSFFKKHSYPLRQTVGSTVNAPSFTLTERNLSLKRRGLSGFAEATGVAGYGDPAGSSNLGFSNVPVPMIGTAWQGLAFDLEAATGLSTSWTGNSYLPGGHSLTPYAIDAFHELGASEAGMGDVSASLANEASYRRTGLVPFHKQRQVFESIMSQHSANQRASIRQISQAKTRLDNGAISLEEFNTIESNARNSILNTGYEVNVARGLMELFDRRNPDENNALRSEGDGESLRNARLQGVSRDSESSSTGFIPQYGVQTISIGGKHIFDLDTFLAPLEDSDTLHIKNGSGSGIPQNIRLHNASALGYYDGSILMLMNGLHEYPDANGSLATVQPADRYVHLSNAVRALGDSTDRGYHLLDKMNVAISSGRAIAENGLLAHAARLGAIEGKDITTTLKTINSTEIASLFEESNGYFSKFAQNFGHEGISFNGLGTNMILQPHVLGVASSVYLRHLILRKNMYVKDGSVLYSQLPGLTGLHMESMLERAKTGEFNKPYSELTPEQKGSISQLLTSIPEETLSYIKSELSSSNISRGVLTTIGAMSAIKLAERQEANPAEFTGTIKSRFLETHAEHGLSIRNSINYAIENELHLSKSVFSQHERMGLGMEGMSEFKNLAESVVHDVGFWHGFLASIKAHDSIEIPALMPPEEAYFRQSSMFGSISHMPGTTKPTWKEVFAEGGYHRDQSFLKVNNTIEGNRYYDAVHGFKQDVGIKSVIDQAVYVRGDEPRQLIHEFNGKDILVGNKDDQRYILRRSKPTTLGEFFGDMNSNADRAHNIANFVAQRNADGAWIVTDEAMSTIKTNKPGQSAQQILIPPTKTNLGMSVRDSLVRKQLENVARQLNTKEISSLAARFPASISIPTVFAGGTTKSRTDFINNRYLTQAMLGIPGDTGVAYAKNDMPRGGISWSRLSDGRIMINYTPAIDLISLHDYNNTGKMSIGLPYKRGLGFDTASGTLIPQSMSRMLALSRQLHYRNTQVKDNGAYINGLIQFDRTVLNHYLNAAKVLSKDFRGEIGGDIGETLTNKYSASILNSNIPLVDIFSKLKDDITKEDTGPIASVDNLIGRNNTIPSYFTLVLPKDAKPEDVQSAIMQLHNNVGLLRDVNSFWGEMEDHRPSTGLTGLSASRADTFHSIYKEQAENYRQRRILKESSTNPEINPLSTAENKTNPSIGMSGGTLKNLVTRNPNFARNIVEMSNKVFSQDSGYSVPEAESRLKISGDRSQVIKLMFPNRPDLLNYAWDSGENLGIEMFRKSDKTGYFVSHNIITGMDASGNPVMGRKATTFRTDAEAKAYIQTIKTGGSLAAVPKLIHGDSGFKIESMGLRASKDTTVQAYVNPHVEFSAMTADSIHAISGPDKFTIGNLDGVYSKKAAAEISKLLNSQDVITGKAPSTKGNVMLSVGELGNARELEKIVRARSSFGISGSPISFSSSLMRVIAYGKILRNAEKPAYTGNEWFKILSENGVSKGEIRATGVAAMLYNTKDMLLSRDEFAQFAAAMYPTFKQIYRRDVHSESMGPGETMFPHRINNPINAINRLVEDHTKLVAELEDHIQSKIAGEQNAEVVAVYTAVADTIRNSMISALGEIVGSERLKELAEDKSLKVSALIANNGWVPQSGPIPELNAATLWIFRQNMAKAFGDVSISQMASAVGVDIKPFEMTLDKYNNTRSDTFEHQLSSDTSPDTLLGNYGYATTTSTSHSNYSSGYGPYSETVLSVGVSDTNVKQIKTYISALQNKMNSAKPEEQPKLMKMIESAENVLKIRENLANQITGNAHYSSGRGNFQISHIRATDNVSIVGTNLNDGPLAMADTFLKPLAERRVIPTVMVEELQSDTYQRGTFGIKDTKLVLPTTLVQAEQMEFLPKITSLEETIAKAQRQKGQLSREFAQTAFIHNHLEHLWNAELMKNRFANSGSMLKIALLKEFEKFTNGSLDTMFHDSDRKKIAEQTKKMFDGLLVKNGRKIVISKELADKYGMESEFEDFTINPNHPLANSLFKAMGERYLGSETNIDTAEFREEAVTALFGKITPILEIDNADRLHYKSNDLSNNSQTATMLDISLQAMMHDELFAASLPRLLADAENNGRFSDAIFDFDALAKRLGPIVEKQISRLDSSGYSRNSTAKAQTRYLLNQVLSDIKHSSEIDGREYVRHEITMENPDRAHGQGGTDNLPEADITNEFLAKKRLFKIIDVEDYVNVENFFKVKELLYKETGRSSIANLTYSRQVHEMTYLEAARTQLKIEAAWKGMTIEEFLNSDVFQTDFGRREREARIAIMSGDPDLITKTLIHTIHHTEEGVKLRNVRPVSGIDGDSSYDYVALESNPLRARSLLGRHLEGQLPAIINMYKSRETIRDLSKLETELANLKSKTKLDVDKSHKWPDVIPLGEDNAYRATSVNFYIMRALQARQEGVVFADARHHRNRYSQPNDAVSVFNYGPLGFGTLDLSNNSGTFEAQMESMVPYAISIAQQTKSHGDIIGRISRGEFDPKNRSDQVEHNGHTASIAKHVELAVDEAFTDALMMTSGGMDLALLARTSGKKISEGFGKLKTFSQEEVLKSLSNRYDEKIAKKVLSAIKNNPSAMVSVPVGTFAGYGANYGQPGWLAKVLYAGQKAEDIIAVSHDAFDAPVVEHANGTFNVIDRKTGKALYTGITDIEELHERVGQNSKYLGRVPIITSFLNQYKQVGFYMLNSHLWRDARFNSSAQRLAIRLNDVNLGSGNMFEQMALNTGIGKFGSEMYAKTQGSLTRVPGYEKTPVVNAGSLAQNKGEGFGPAIWGRQKQEIGASTTTDKNSDASMAIGLHSMGLRKDASTKEIAAAANQLAGFTSPVMIIKPKFATEAHKHEMRRMIVNGVPLMSVGDFKNPNIKIKRAMDDYKWLINYKPIPRNQDDETNR